MMHEGAIDRSMSHGFLAVGGKYQRASPGAAVIMYWTNTCGNGTRGRPNPAGVNFLSWASWSVCVQSIPIAGAHVQRVQTGFV